MSITAGRDLIVPASTGTRKFRLLRLPVGLPRFTFHLSYELARDAGKSVEWKTAV